MADLMDECRNKTCEWCGKKYAYHLMIGELCQTCAEDDDVCVAMEREGAMEGEVEPCLE